MFVIKRSILFIAIIIATVIWGIPPKPIYALDKNIDLWQKAVQIAAQSQNFVPGKSHMLVEEMNRQGKITKKEEIWLQLTVDQEKKLKVECLKILKNGNDVTEKEKNRYENNSSKSSKRTLTFGNNDLNPFDPKVQNDVYYHPTDRKEVINQIDCVVYEYTWRRSADQTQKGTTWLAADTGMPLLIKFTLDPKLKYIKSYWATSNYSLNSGLWYPETGDMEASGGFLFKRFHVRVHFTLSDYWLFEQTD
jgi:hypothetical protein